MTKRLQRIVFALLLVVGIVGMVAVAPSAAVQSDATPTPEGAETTAQTATPTPTPTPSGEDSSQSSERETTRNADLDIAQPKYVDSAVGQDSQNGTVVYQVSGGELILTIENINTDTDPIRNFGVEESDATLIQREGTYVLTPDVDGTYSVWWTTQDGVTYEAYIQVETADYVHLSADEHASQEAKADAWDDFVRELHHAGIIHGDEDIEELQHVSFDAVSWYHFYINPFSALTGGFVAILTILVSQPGGWLFLALLLAVFGLSTYTLVKRNRTLERQFRDIEDLDEADRRAWEQEIKRNASKATLQDWGLTDSEAEAVKQHTGARNPRQFATWIAGNIGEYRVIRTLLAAYQQLGHELEVRREPSGEIVDVQLVKRADELDEAGSGGTAVVADGGDSEIQVEYIAEPARADEDVLKRLDWTSLEGDVLWNPKVDTADLTLPVQNDRHSEGFDLIEDADIPIGEDGADHYILRRREEFVDILITIVEEAAASTYTDEDGRPRPEVDFVEMVYTFCAKGAEKYRLPFWHIRDVLLTARGQLDDDERLDQLASKSEDNEL